MKKLHVSVQARVVQGCTIYYKESAHALPGLGDPKIDSQPAGAPRGLVVQVPVQTLTGSRSEKGPWQFESKDRIRLTSSSDSRQEGLRLTQPPVLSIPSVAWVRPTHVGEGDLLCSVYGFTCKSQPETPSQTRPGSCPTRCLHPHSPVMMTHEINCHTARGETRPSKEPAALGAQGTLPATVPGSVEEPEVISSRQRGGGGGCGQRVVLALGDRRFGCVGTMLSKLHWARRRFP